MVVMVIDVENNIPMQDIVQFSYIIYDDEHNIKKQINKYIKNRIIDDFSKSIHGISQNKINNDGVDFKDCVNEFLQDMNDINTIIGHAVNTDISKIKKNIAKYCEYIDVSELFTNKQIFDTYIVSDKVYKKKMKLGVLYTYLYGETMTNAHDAYYDCVYTYECYKKLKDCVIVEEDKIKKPRKKKNKEEIVIHHHCQSLEVDVVCNQTKTQ